MTREDWLKEATLLIEQQILMEQNVNLPLDWTVSVGFPYGNTRAIGQAWDKAASADDKTHNIFISPILGKDDIVNLLQVLLHEAIHIAVGVDQKHGGEFKRVARSVGLEGKLTATFVSPNTVLYNRLLAIAEKLGEYPHEQIQLKTKEKKKRESNFITLVSTNNPEYTLKIKKQIVEEHGYPLDSDGDEMVEENE